MEIMKTTALATLLAMTALGAPASAATIVMNGSFEQDAGAKGSKNKIDFTKLVDSPKGWDTFASLPGWDAPVKKSDITVHADKGAKEVDAAFGEHYVELDSKTSPAIRQTLSLSVGSYLLSFFVSPADFGGNNDDKDDKKKTNGISYSIAELTGTVLGTSDKGDTAIGKWTEVTGRFDIAKDGFYDLDFAAFSSVGVFRGYIDNISVEAARIEPAAVAPSPVPVPAAGLLLVGAVAALGSLARRRRSA
jgi:hypothetical protein